MTDTLQILFAVGFVIFICTHLIGAWQQVTTLIDLKRRVRDLEYRFNDMEIRVARHEQFINELKETLESRGFFQGNKRPRTMLDNG